MQCLAREVVEMCQISWLKTFINYQWLTCYSLLYIDFIIQLVQKRSPEEFPEILVRNFQIVILCHSSALLTPDDQENETSIDHNR